MNVPEKEPVKKDNVSSITPLSRMPKKSSLPYPVPGRPLLVQPWTRGREKEKARKAKARTRVRMEIGDVHRLERETEKVTTINRENRKR